MQGHPGPQVGGAEEAGSCPLLWATAGCGSTLCIDAKGTRLHCNTVALLPTQSALHRCSLPCPPCSADGAVDLDRSDACYDTTTRVVVKIVDTCPCKGNEVRRSWQRCGTGRRDGTASRPAYAQTSHLAPHTPPCSQPPQKWCCGDAGLVHFDLSDGAFSRLAPQVRCWLAGTLSLPACLCWLVATQNWQRCRGCFHLIL